MIDWLKEAVACYQFHIPYAVGSGKIIWIFVASIFLIFLWRGKEEPHSRFAWFLAMLMLLVLNPFLVPAINSLTNGDYWRVLWVLAMPVVIAFAFVKVVWFLPKTAGKVIGAALLTVSLVFVGTYQYNAANFVKPENLYKIPQDVVEICDLINGEVEEPKLISDDDVNYWVRQYDATIISESARFGVGNDVIHEIMNSEETYDLETLKEKAGKKKCNCVALRTDRLPENPEDGYTLLGKTASGAYEVYEIAE